MPTVKLEIIKAIKSDIDKRNKKFNIANITSFLLITTLKTSSLIKITKPVGTVMKKYHEDLSAVIKWS